MAMSNQSLALGIMANLLVVEGITPEITHFGLGQNELK